MLIPRQPPTLEAPPHGGTSCPAFAQPELVGNVPNGTPGTRMQRLTVSTLLPGAWVHSTGRRRIIPQSSVCAPGSSGQHQILSANRLIKRAPGRDRSRGCWPGTFQGHMSWCRGNSAASTGCVVSFEWLQTRTTCGYGGQSTIIHSPCAHSAPGRRPPPAL